jgi:hypothetical protein
MCGNQLEPFGPHSISLSNFQAAKVFCCFSKVYYFSFIAGVAVEVCTSLQLQNHDDETSTTPKPFFAKVLIASN